MLASLLTTKETVLKQSTFYTLALFSRYARGNAPELLVQSPRYPTPSFGEQPLLDASASHDPGSGVHGQPQP